MWDPLEMDGVGGWSSFTLKGTLSGRLYTRTSPGAGFSSGRRSHTSSRTTASSTTEPRGSGPQPRGPGGVGPGGSGGAATGRTVD